MNPVGKWKSFAFVGSLFVVALIIHSGVNAFRQLEAEPRRSDSQGVTGSRVPSSTGESILEREKRLAVAAKEAAEARAVAREAFLARYINAPTNRQPGTKLFGVVVAMDNRELNRPFATVIAKHIRSEKLTTATSVFTQKFVADGLFAEAFQGSQDILNRLELRKILDALLLARQTIGYSTNSSLQNVITANIQLEILMLPISEEGESQSWKFIANGVGFKPAEARLMAEERLINELTNETNMLFTLNTLSTP
jgi:hypothetical protein